MALTLAQYESSTQPAVAGKIIQVFRDNNWLMEKLEFEEGALPTNTGKRSTWQYNYDEVTTESTAATRDVNVEFAEQEEIYTERSQKMKILGGKAAVDRVMLLNGRVEGDRLARQIDAKTKSVMRLFNNLFINGDEGANAQQFNGLNALLTGTTSEITPAANIEIDTAANAEANADQFAFLLDEAIATMHMRPDALFLNTKLWARLHTVAKKIGYLTQSEDAFGRQVVSYQGIPFVDLGWISAGNPVVPIDGGGLTSIYAGYFGPDGIHGVMPNVTDQFVKVYRTADTDPSVKRAVDVEVVTAIVRTHSASAAVLRNIKVQ